MHDYSKEILKKWIKEEEPYHEDMLEYRLELYSHPQGWGSTACGFGGLAGQAITTAQTNVFLSRHLDIALVFHAGKFAYASRISREFGKALKEQRLPGYTGKKDFDVLFTRGFMKERYK